MDINLQTATDPEIARELGRRLRALRKARGLTLNEVSAEAALDRTTVSRAEHGDNPTLFTLLRLLRTYGRLGALAAFIPDPEVSPMALLRERRRTGGQGG